MPYEAKHLMHVDRLINLLYVISLLNGQHSFKTNKVIDWTFSSKSLLEQHSKPNRSGHKVTEQKSVTNHKTLQIINGFKNFVCH